MDPAWAAGSSAGSTFVAVGQPAPGLHVDELGVADFAMRQVFFSPYETINPFITGPESHPVLFHYIVAGFIKLFGPHIFSLRLQTALVGTLGVLATYLMVRAFSGKQTALFAALLMVTYHYHVHWSRISLNNIWDTLWVPLMLGPFLWGWRKRWSGGAALSGLAVGLSQYFYPGSKIGLVLLGGADPGDVEGCPPRTSPLGNLPRQVGVGGSFARLPQS